MEFATLRIPINEHVRRSAGVPLSVRITPLRANDVSYDEEWQGSVPACQNCGSWFNRFCSLVASSSSSATWQCPFCCANNEVSALATQKLQASPISKFDFVDLPDTEGYCSTGHLLPQAVCDGTSDVRAHMTYIVSLQQSSPGQSAVALRGIVASIASLPLRCSFSVITIERNNVIAMWRRIRGPATKITRQPFTVPIHVPPKFFRRCFRESIFHCNDHSDRVETADALAVEIQSVVEQETTTADIHMDVVKPNVILLAAMKVALEVFESEFDSVVDVCQVTLLLAGCSKSDACGFDEPSDNDTSTDEVTANLRRREVTVDVFSIPQYVPESCLSWALATICRETGGCFKLYACGNDQDHRNTAQPTNTDMKVDINGRKVRHLRCNASTREGLQEQFELHMQARAAEFNFVRHVAVEVRGNGRAMLLFVNLHGVCCACVLEVTSVAVRVDAHWTKRKRRTASELSQPRWNQGSGVSQFRHEEVSSPLVCSRVRRPLILRYRPGVCVGGSKFRKSPPTQTPSQQRRKRGSLAYFAIRRQLGRPLPCCVATVRVFLFNGGSGDMDETASTPCMHASH